MLNDDWPPHVDVVQLPAWMRQADPRALAVRDRDRKDFPAAAVAGLLAGRTPATWLPSTMTGT
jgi:hypothetical protein